MSDQSKPQPDKHTVLLYSDDLAVRDRIRMAIGVRPAADLAVEFVDASTWEECRRLLDTYEIDLMVLDGEDPGGRRDHERHEGDAEGDQDPQCGATHVGVGRRADATGGCCTGAGHVPDA